MLWARLGGMIVMLLTIAACGGSSDLKVDAHLKAVTQSQVGGDDGFTITIRNQDTDISNLLVLLADGQDNWLDHHVVLNTGKCTVDKSLSELKCGELRAGQTMVVTMLSSPEDSGNFDYGFGVGDDRAGNLRQWKYQATYSEAVRQR